MSQEPAGRGNGGEAHSVVSDSENQMEVANSGEIVAAESLTVEEDSEVAEMLRDNEVPSQW